SALAIFSNTRPCSGRWVSTKASVHEVKLRGRQRISDNIVGAHFQPWIIESCQKPRIRIGCQNTPHRSNPFTEPGSDRPSTTGNFQAMPSRGDAYGFQTPDRCIVAVSFQSRKPLTSQLPVVIGGIL